MGIQPAFISAITTACAPLSNSQQAETNKQQPRKRFRARISYDGTGYHGWQFQNHTSTVQGAVENALARRLTTPIRVVGASRTDSGVHSRGQAVHFDVPLPNYEKGAADVDKFEFTMNQLLPSDIRMSHVEVAPFVAPLALSMGDYYDAKRGLWNAIYCSKGKLYSYRFCTARILDPLQRHFRYHEWRAPRRGFCERRLRDAAAKFVGTYDFTAFTNTSLPPPGIEPPVLVNPLRTVHFVKVVNEGDGMFRVDFSISGALYRMIRNIMGTILDVSVGAMEVDDIDTLFESRDRRLVPKSAPACGLCLEEVYYDDWKM